MTRGQLLANISSAELTDWIALRKLEYDERVQAEKEAEAERQMKRGPRGY